MCVRERVTERVGGEAARGSAGGCAAVIERPSPLAEPGGGAASHGRASGVTTGGGPGGSPTDCFDLVSRDGGRCPSEGKEEVMKDAQRD